jgi:two-component system, cell cycle sensor histidine kinase and response regulator CckA
VNEPLQALLVEDSETDAKIVTHVLRRALGAIDSERVDTAASLREALERRDWDVVICDWSMPEFGGIAAIEILKDTNLDIPLIIVSGTVGEELAVRAMRAGARDYVLKDKLVRLPPVVEREIKESKARRERRQSDQALRASEVRFARLSESGIVGIAIADVMGHITEANDAFLRLVGYTRDELLSGQVRWTDMTPPEFKHLGEKAVESLTTAGVAPPWETEQIHKDGTRVPVMVAVAMLEYPKTIAIVTDLSERRRAEAALRRTEEQLRHAQKMEAIGILAGGVAHDFNNVLSIILGYCGMLLEDLDDANPMRADIAEIKTAGDRGAALTRQLLAFSRQQIIETKILDLNEVIGDMDSMLRRLVREDIDFVTTPGVGLGRCKADAGQIEQILMNLVINAIDAMPEGGKLRIDTANADLDDEYVVAHAGMKPGRYVMLAVSDTGVGMSKATRDRIFEPFFTTKDKGKGTGLGLSTVFGIVEQTGGSIYVYSELGRGSAFKVYLPRVDDVPAATSVKAPAQLARGAETVLLVEDQDQLRTVIISVLTRSGYRVLEGRDGYEALRICEQHVGPIELLLTDVVMPQMNGRQLAERVVTMRPGIKVLYMSGYTDGILVGQLSCAAAFLQKPFTGAVLTRKVRETLDSADEARPLP